MIPTAVIVSDNNNELAHLYQKLKLKLRVVKRSSIEGEQLYSTSSPFFEGVIYFDSQGQRQLTRQDVYSGIEEDIDNKLKLLSAKDRDLLQRYLVLQGAVDEKK